MFKSTLKDFAVALTLLTIIPAPARWLDASRPLGKSSVWFPLIGLLLGVALALILLVARNFFSDLVAAALVIALWAWLTGALHLEGLADAADGLGATTTRERRLEIMRDPRVGAFGVVGVAIGLLAKLAAVASLHDPFFLILAPSLARWAIVFAAAFPLARADGMAARLRVGLGRREILIATVITALITGVFGTRGIGAWIAALVFVLLIARLARNRLGGFTGDVYGAVVEIVEMIVVVLA